MAKLTFKGGIHPYDGKELSKDKPIKAVEVRGQIVYNDGIGKGTGRNEKS